MVNGNVARFHLKKKKAEVGGVAGGSIPFCGSALEISHVPNNSNPVLV